MVVVADKAGRLGNKLLLSAHLIAASADQGFRIFLPAFGEHHRWFPMIGGPLPIYPSVTGSPLGSRAARVLLFYLARVLGAVASRSGWRGNKWVRAVRLQEGDRLDLESLATREEIRSTKLMVLQGWLFRAPTAFISHSDEVRRVLSPDPSILSAARDQVEEARAGGDTVVGIHIRQGDYEQHLGGRFYFPSKEYVATMERLLALLPGRVRFLVTTDSPQEWGRFDHLPYKQSDGTAIADLFTLAACDYICGPPSSFTLWASFYGEVPLAMIVSRGRTLTLDDFRIAPEIPDPSVASLY